MDTNVRSTFLFTRHTVRCLAKVANDPHDFVDGGSLRFCGEAGYCMTKFAQVGL